MRVKNKNNKLKIGPKPNGQTPPCKCMIRKGKSHDDSVKIKQIMQSEKVETE